MVLIMLGSTTSWTVEKHYCMGHLVDIAWFVDAEDCGMNMVLAESDIEMPDEMSCCANEIIHLDGQDEVKLNFNPIDLHEQTPYLLITYVWVTFYQDYPVKKPIQHIHPPPILVKDILLLDEVLLI